VGHPERGELVVLELLAIDGLELLAQVARARRRSEPDLEGAERRVLIVESLADFGESERELLGFVAGFDREAPLHDVGARALLALGLVHALERGEDLARLRIPIERRVVDVSRLVRRARLEELAEALRERA